MNIEVARDHVLQRLLDQFAGLVDPDTVTRYVDQGFAEFSSHAEVDSWIPVMAERYVRQELTALVKAEGHQDSLPVVLFVDSGDAGRSQLARALFERHAGDRVHSWSGGFDPATQLLPEVSEPLLALGVDPVKEFPKPVSDGVMTAADVVVVLGDLPGAVPTEKRTLLWQVPPVAGMSPAEVQDVVALLDGLTGELARRLS